MAAAPSSGAGAATGRAAVVSRHPATLKHVAQALGVPRLGWRQAIGPAVLPRSSRGEFELVLLDLDLDATAPPALTDAQSAAFTRVVRCRQAGALEALIVYDARMDCEQCSCAMKPHADVFYASAADLPAWWPCGTTVAFCESDLPLYAIDPACLTEP